MCFVTTIASLRGIRLFLTHRDKLMVELIHFVAGYSAWSIINVVPWLHLVVFLPVEGCAIVHRFVVKERPWLLLTLTHLIESITFRDRIRCGGGGVHHVLISIVLKLFHFKCLLASAQ